MFRQQSLGRSVEIEKQENKNKHGTKNTSKLRSLFGSDRVRFGRKQEKNDVTLKSHD